MAPSYHCGKLLFTLSNLRSNHLSQGAYARGNPIISRGGAEGIRFTLLLSGSTAAEKHLRAVTGANLPQGLHCR